MRVPLGVVRVLLLAIAVAGLAGIPTRRRRAQGTSSRANFVNACSRVRSQEVVDRGARSGDKRVPSRGNRRVALLSAALVMKGAKEEATLGDLQVRGVHVRQVQEATLGAGGAGGDA